ncbi:MAG TPA: LLM class flavin-dependent oxidoreductase, partial [Candidatus Dormibacteraeota bacterium]|nr:LLM class flavin-dependent oxidoreductase [Candidatus Dormibacteraeota bacterium]
HLAENLATLDQLSRGRLEVGVGLGGRPDTLPAFGIDPSSRVARFNEGLRLVKALWTEPRVTFGGRFWQLDRAASEPKPFQKPHPRVWFGGGHPAALQRAARHGDAFFGAGSATTAQFAEQVRTLRELLQAAGRDAASFPIAKRVYVAVDDDAARAEARIDDFFDHLYGRRGMTGVAVFGPPEDCVRGIREVAEAGAGLILFTTMFDQLEQMERLSAEVVPHLSS